MQDIRPPRRTQPRGAVRSDSRERVIVRTVVSRSQMINYGYLPQIEPEPVQVADIEPIIQVDESIDLEQVFNTISMIESQPAPWEHSENHVGYAMVRQPEIPRKFGLKRFVFGGLAVIVLAATGYVSVDTWMTNTQVQAEFSQSGVASESSDASVVDHQATEGKDESEPTRQTLASYAVSPDVPRAIYINKINVSARVLPMAVNKDGSMQAPRNIFDAGWYTGSVKPGDIGAMFVDGHASGPTREGLFAYLDKLVDGDMIEIEKGDGTRLTYRVVHTEVQDLESIDMKRMLLPYGTSLRGLNLMTCTGKWLEDKQTFDSRVVVFAEQV